VTELSLGSFGINCCCILILKASANFHLKCPSWFEFGRLVWLCSISWQAGTRLFGFVGAGATLGQLIGSLLAVAMAHLGPGNHLSNSHLNLMVMCNQRALAPPSFASL
jgi:hypothetical protein